MPASLALTVSSRFGESLCLKKFSGEQQRETPNVSLCLLYAQNVRLYPHVHTPDTKKGQKEGLEISDFRLDSN